MLQDKFKGGSADKNASRMKIPNPMTRTNRRKRPVGKSQRLLAKVPLLRLRMLLSEEGLSCLGLLFFDFIRVLYSLSPESQDGNEWSPSFPRYPGSLKTALFVRVSGT
jgi:hypothetical protein